MLSRSIQETHLIARELLTKPQNTNIICLYGELGAGKTTFVQGLAQALGIKRRILSPTFVLIREYEIKQPVSSSQQPVRKNWQLATGNWQHLIHADCYRINSEEDIKSIDLEEIWFDPKNLVVIEWAERISKILPKERIDIKFEHINKNTRNIKIVNC